MSQLIISVSGLRGIVGETLTPEIAVRYAGAFVATLPAGPIVLSYDGRESGPMFLQAIAEGLAAAGRNVLVAGVAATPTTGVLVQSLQAVGGIQISASHNPPEYNGLKLFSSAGRVIPAAAGQRVIEHFQIPGGAAAADRHGSITQAADTTSEHLKRVLDVVDAERIRGKRFRVLLDANHGSGSMLGGKLLEALGCEVRLMGGSPDGKFAHPPEPTAENLAGVLSAVTAEKANIGFCQDPDADRLAVMDERGRYLGEEYTFALCADHTLRRTPGPMVTNCSTSRMTADLAKKYHAPFYRAAVGEANVVDVMLEQKAVLGGEGNGGVIDPRVVLVRDSFVGMAMILDAMAERNQAVSQLADELPRYEIEKTKISLPREKLAGGYTALEKHFAEAAPDRLDGLRLDWPDKWLLIRPSNTEPIVRAVAEAPTAAEARRLCREAETVLGRV